MVSICNSSSFNETIFKLSDFNQTDILCIMQGNTWRYSHPSYIGQNKSCTMWTLKKEVKVPENVAININNQSINQSIKAFTITKGL